VSLTGSRHHISCPEVFSNAAKEQKELDERSSRLQQINNEKN